MNNSYNDDKDDDIAIAGRLTRPYEDRYHFNLVRDTSSNRLSPILWCARTIQQHEFQVYSNKTLFKPVLLSKPSTPPQTLSQLRSSTPHPTSSQCDLFPSFIITLRSHNPPLERKLLPQQRYSPRRLARRPPDPPTIHHARGQSLLPNQILPHSAESKGFGKRLFVFTT